METIGLTRASSLTPAVRFLTRIGAPVRAIMAEAGLPEWVLDDPDRLIPTSATARFLDRAARTQGIEILGFLAGQESRVEDLGTYGSVIRRSPTLGDALQATVRNHRLHSSNGRMWLVTRGDDTDLCFAFTSRFGAEWRQADHYALMCMLSLIRLGAGPTWRPSAVRLQTSEFPAIRHVEPLCGTHVAFSQPATAVAFPTALLHERVRPRLEVEVSPESIKAWKASSPARDFAESISQVVEMLSWERYPDVDLTADVLGMSVRTLQRHLAAVGLTHESLVGRARFATAASLLEETDTKILDIALDLGYSDHAHFTRAFRRWAGCSPQQFRRWRREWQERSPQAAT